MISPVDMGLRRSGDVDYADRPERSGTPFDDVLRAVRPVDDRRGGVREPARELGDDPHGRARNAAAPTEPRARTRDDVAPADGRAETTVDGAAKRRSRRQDESGDGDEAASFVTGQLRATLEMSEPRRPAPTAAIAGDLGETAATADADLPNSTAMTAAQPVGAEPAGAVFVGDESVGAEPAGADFVAAEPAGADVVARGDGARGAGGVLEAVVARSRVGRRPSRCRPS